MKRGLRLLLPAGVIAILVVFLLRAFDVVAVGRGAVVFGYLALGPLGMLGCLELAQFLDRAGDDVRSRAGAAFGASAFLLWEVVHAIQLGTPPLWRQYVSPELVELLPEGEQSVRLLFLGFSSVQATVDVAFDVFFCLAIIAFSLLMFSRPAFGPFTAVFGLAAAGGPLALNLWTFPLPPSEAGAWDLGPLTAIWWILVIVQWQRHESAARNENRSH